MYMYVRVCIYVYICIYVQVSGSVYTKGHIQKDCIINSLLNEVQNVAEIFTAVVRTDWVYTMQMC